MTHRFPVDSQEAGQASLALHVALHHVRLLHLLPDELVALILVLQEVYVGVHVMARVLLARARLQVVEVVVAAIRNVDLRVRARAEV